MNISRFWVLGVLAGSACLSFSQQETKDAEAMIREIDAASRTAKTTETASSKLAAEVSEFAKHVSTMAPAEAAAKWVEYCKRSLLASSRSQYDGPIGSAVNLAAALPGPAAWPAIATKLQATFGPKSATDPQSAAYVLLGRVLSGSPASQWQAFDTLQRATKKPAGNSSDYGGYRLSEIQLALAAQTGDAARVGAALDAMIHQPIGGQSLTLPDLVVLLGPAKAQALLERVFLNTKFGVVISGGQAMRRLAVKVALQQIAKLQVPQWGLCQSKDAFALYEALNKRFPKKGANERYERGSAAGYYIAGLIERNRIMDAVKVANGIGADTYSSRVWLQELSGSEDKIRSFSGALHDILAKDPKSGLWETYVQIATQAGHSEEMVALVRSALKSDLGKAIHRTLESSLISALLATDQVEGAITLLRTPSSVVDDPESEGSTSAELSPGFRLAQLGIVLKRNELFEEGVSILKKKMASQEGVRPETPGYYAHYYFTATFDLLINAGRFSEGQELLLNEVKSSPKNSYGNSMGEIPTNLVKLYYKMGRYADVLYVADNCPWWDERDLSEITSSSYRGVTSEDPIAYMIADSLVHSGRSAEAMPIALQLVTTERGYDPGYSLLVQLKGEAALPILDDLYKQDHFQERPLIWKAKELLELKRLDEAEKTIRQAISVDPSDGETGLGRRMFGYTVLADILDAQGKSEEAGIMRSAVRAIRMSEEADGLFTAGLTTRAIKLYKQSLTVFQDAYCIQSRLAVQLSSEGKFDEAAQHYRRAFELMPNSFGQLESHCFGCEGVFEGAEAQNIAEKVFTELLQKTPNKAQVHYLFAYLRMEQERYDEAYKQFKEAARLDPDYINAWDKMREISDKLAIPATDRDQIARALARLDPLGLHIQQAGDARNLKAIYETADAAARATPFIEVPDSLYPFRASASKSKLERGDVPDFGSMRKLLRNQLTPKTGGEAVAGTSLISKIGVILGWNQDNMPYFSG